MREILTGPMESLESERFTFNHLPPAFNRAITNFTCPKMSLGVVVATETSPTPNIFHFVISEENARSLAENGTFVQIRNKDNSLTLGMIQTLRRTNRYFSSTDMIHGSSSGLAPPQLFPAERWDYIIAETKVLGVFKEGLQQRSTKPVLPGSEVYACWIKS